jgi:hypothetical protein
VLSRSLTLAGPGQDHFDEVTSIHLLVRVKQCGLIGPNVLQGTSLGVLVLSGRMHCDGAKTYDSHNNQHCRDQAFVDLSLELFHKFGRLQSMLISVNYKNQKISILAFQAMLVKSAACLNYLCGFLLSLKAHGGTVRHLKSK